MVYFISMTKNSDALDSVFAALSDPTRRAIVAKLASDEQSLSSLAEPFDISQTAVSKHVRVLCDSGLVTMEKRGRTRYCRLNPDNMQKAANWLEQYRDMWLQSFDKLGRYLAEDSKKKKTRGRKRNA